METQSNTVFSTKEVHSFVEIERFVQDAAGEASANRLHQHAINGEQSWMAHRLSAREYQKPYTDSLTGLPDFEAFYAVVTGQIARADLTVHPVSVMLIDIDGLRQINLDSGRAAGDAVLVHVGGVLRRNIRTADIVARLGSDCFGVVLDGADLAISGRKAQQLADGVAADPIDCGTRQFSVGVSIGYTLLSGHGDVGSVFAGAIRSMKNGRNPRASAASIN